MNSLTKYIRSFAGREITLLFASGDSVCGTLDRILPEDALVLRFENGRVAICSTANLNMIHEGRFMEEEDDDICVN